MSDCYLDFQNSVSLRFPLLVFSAHSTFVSLFAVDSTKPTPPYYLRSQISLTSPCWQLAAGQTFSTAGKRALQADHPVSNPAPPLDNSGTSLFKENMDVEYYHAFDFEQIQATITNNM